MLGRAAQKYEASAPPALTNPALAKQLFPSSSPSTQDGSISDMLSKRGLGAGAPSSASSASSKAVSHHPLKPTTPNSLHSALRREPSSTLASLYSNPGSFKEEPAASTQGSQGNTVASVFIADEDFSDDENLDLDYACPAALPPTSKPAAPPVNLPRNPSTPAHLSSSSQIPWTSSPQEHFFPPALKQALKRPSPDSNPAPTNQVKKRSLPKHWGQEKTDRTKAAQDDDDVLPEAWRSKKNTRPQPSVSHPRAEDLYVTQPVATPANKRKNAEPWNATYSATKEQRKQLKNANRKAEQEPELSVSEIQGVTDSHAKAKASAISLSSEQQQVLDLVIKKKQSVFFTGPAGTGKSVLMRAIIAELKKKWARDPERLSVTASTGLAACNIGGMTLHSFAGIGLGAEEWPELVRKIRRNPKAKNRWLRTNTLIIDEISMVDGDLFDKLGMIAKTIRNNGRPWGGIQLVITGDFFQLPPVPGGDKGGNKREAKFAFDASIWNTSIDHTIGLTQVFRQRDPQFAGMLNEMRLGRISDESVSVFKGLSRPLQFDDGLEVTELFPTRQEVERSNEGRLRSLPGQIYHYEAHDTGEPNIRDKLLQNMMAPKGIDLKKGAQVMLIKNMDDTLVNGSLGKVIGFMTETVFEHWSGAQEDGEGEADEGDVGAAAKRKLKAFSRDPDGSKDVKEYPMVRFTSTDGSHRVLLCIPEDWKVELPNGEVQASRKQLPLILAWALSIHKAQGQTLERVKVDLGKVFEKGQAYVALSRATTKQGLQVLRFEKNKVMAHAKVVAFYNRLYSAESALKKKGPMGIKDFIEKGAQGFDDDEEAMAAYG